jgi:mRNA deadenylase 3'-5' endonuclease subunit Ccr4
MQFNILADGPAQEQFKHKWKKLERDLEWRRRFKRVLEEVIRVNPDLLLMEEVNHYEDFWRNELQRIGYDGIFLPKYSTSYKSPNKRPPPFFHGKPSDGCLLFVKTKRLKLGNTITRRFAEVLSPGMS